MDCIPRNPIRGMSDPKTKVPFSRSAKLNRSNTFQPLDGCSSKRGEVYLLIHPGMMTPKLFDKKCKPNCWSSLMD